jgi:hypothetical protein
MAGLLAGLGQWRRREREGGSGRREWEEIKGEEWDIVVWCNSFDEVAFGCYL